MSPDTLRFFQELLQQVQVPASAANFEELANRIVTARRELNEALEKEAT